MIATVALLVSACASPHRSTGHRAAGHASSSTPSPTTTSTSASVPRRAVTSRRASTGNVRSGPTTAPRSAPAIDAAGTTRASARPAKASARPATASPPPTAGPHLVGGNAVPGTSGCTARADADYVHYVAVVHVYGSVARHHWLMRVTTAAGSSGPSEPMSARAIDGGVEYRFESTAVLPAPGRAPETITQEQVLDAGTTPPTYHYTALDYPGGGLRVTNGSCR